MAASVRGIHRLLALVLLVTGFAPVRAAEETPPPREGPYFYKGLGFGSDAAFHPVSELINGSLGVLQISSRWVPLDEIRWSRGFDVTWKSISRPDKTISAYGRREFLSNELLPLDYGWNNLQWVPNYTLHLIGGGARHRAFVEWYEAHDVPLPTACAWATTLLHAWGVEAIEHYNSPGTTVDPVADMLLFDPLGALLFSSDRVSRFFSHTLSMSIWSGQPAYNPMLNVFENIGQNYALHYFFSDRHRLGIFSYMGMGHLLGVTVRGGDRFDWSVGIGSAADELREADIGNGMSAVYANMKFAGGIFLHRRGSLLASLHGSTAWKRSFRFDIYPGWLAVGDLSAGFYSGMRGNETIVGITFANVPIGLALSSSP
jgi:hypothetical protein